MLYWHKALWLVKSSHITWTHQIRELYFSIAYFSYLKICLLHRLLECPIFSSKYFYQNRYKLPLDRPIEHFPKQINWTSSSTTTTTKKSVEKITKNKMRASETAAIIGWLVGHSCINFCHNNLMALWQFPHPAISPTDVSHRQTTFPSLWHFSK